MLIKLPEPADEGKEKTSIFSGSIKKLPGSKDGNVSIRIEVKQILVAGDDACGICFMGKFKIFIVFRIAAVGNGFSYPNDMGLMKERHKKMDALVLVDVLFKVGAAQHLVKFVDDRFG